MSRPPSHAEFSVGWICALPLEMAAAKAMLDEIYGNLQVQPNDQNAYTLGRIGEHNVVIACLPSGQYGIASASTVAMQLLSSFQSVTIGLLVGIGGGIPLEEVDVRLGDVVVGLPSSSNTHGGVVQYDLGKAGQGDKFKRTGMLNRPPQILLTAVSKLRALHQLEESHISTLVDEMGRRYSGMRETLTAHQYEDLLFDANYYHDNTQSTCSACDRKRLVDRPKRKGNAPMIHYGLIASGNQVVKDSHFRDRLGRELKACCVEMEAAGLMNNYPCLVIRGICDYADSHKNKAWQEYAAAVAAAYAKELLLVTSSASTPARMDNFLETMPSRADDTDHISASDAKILRKRVLRSLRPSALEIPCLGQANPSEYSWVQMFNNQDFDAWYRGEDMDTNHGLVWIKGKPGSGKSSFSKQAFCRASGELQRNDVSVNAFFRGDSDLRWEPLDLFRALLYQLFLTCNDDCLIFTKMFDDKIQRAKKKIKWRQDELKTFLNTTFAQPRPNRTIFFVDGLDECEQSGMREMALFFRELTSTAYKADAKLSVCLSSREFPRVSVGRCPEILIDRFNGDEIQRYVHRKLTMAGFDKDVNWLRIANAIVDRSAGVFLWVVIVLDALLEDWDTGHNLTYLERRLQETPPALERLYEKMLSNVSKEETRMTLRFFYWAILATKPLRLFEWHHVLAWIRDTPPYSLAEWRNSGYFTETASQLERQIQRISRGLVEVKSSKVQRQVVEKDSTCGDAGSLNSEEGETRTVQVIHSSVAEYFLCGRGFSVLDPSVGDRLKALGAGHLSMLSSCLDYIEIPELDDLAERRQMAARRADEWKPQSQTRPCNRAGSVASFGSSASNYAGSTHSGQYRDPVTIHPVAPNTWQPLLNDCYGKRGASDEADVAPQPGMPFALRQYLEDPMLPVTFSDLERAASEIESLRSEDNVSQTSQTLQDFPDFLMHALNAFPMHAKKADTYGASPDRILRRFRFANCWQRWLCLADTFAMDTTLLYFAADQGLVTWIEALLSSGVNPNVRGGEHTFPLIAAVISKHAKVTGLLLKAGALPTQTDRLYGSSLHHIAHGGSNQVLECFCENMPFNTGKGQELLNALDSSGRTPLHIAVQNGHLRISTKLLRLGADPRLTDRDGKSSLHLAAESEKSHSAVYYLLLRTGASPRLQSLRSLTPVQLALEKGFLDRIPAIEDYLFRRSQRLLGSPQPILTIRLTDFRDLAQRSRPYIRITFAGDTMTLYPTQAWPENQPRREKVHFSIPPDIKKRMYRGQFSIHGALSLRLYTIQESRHVRVRTAWCMEYVKVQDGKKKTAIHQIRQSSTQVSLEVTVPPLVEI